MDDMKEEEKLRARTELDALSGSVGASLDSCAILLARGMDGDARLVLRHALENLVRMRESLARFGEDWKHDTAANLLEGLSADIPEGECGAALQTGLDRALWIHGDLRRGLGLLKTRELKTRRDVYRRIIASVCALAVILSCLAVGVWGPGAYREYTIRQEKERTRQVQAILPELAALAKDAKNASGKTLVELTGETCGECPCLGAGDLRKLFAFDVCAARWEKALQRMLLAARGTREIPDRFLRDPWGSPFALNENEGEVKGECTPDVIRSAGPDGVLNTSDDIGIQASTVFCEQPKP